MKKLLGLILWCTMNVSYAQNPVTTIPFELYGDHIIVKAVVDDSEPLDMIFDTGAGITVIDQDVADNLELVIHKIILNEGTVSGSLIKHNTIDINGFRMEKNIKVYATDLRHLEMSLGREIDGILGYDLMRHHTVRVDYNRKLFEIYDLGESPTSGSMIPFKLNMTIPTVEGSVLLNNNEPHPGTFYVMTGAGTTLDFNAPYSEKYDVIHKTGKHFSYMTKSISNVETKHYEGHILSLFFGDQKIDDLPVGISTATTGLQASKDVSGIIGNQILRMYNITYDFHNKSLYLMKNANYGKKLMVNCSGIDIQMSHDMKKVLIHQIIEDSPASEAGIATNAELLQVNGMSMDEINFPTIRDIFKRDGSSVDILIKENGTERNITLELRSLID